MLVLKIDARSIPWRHQSYLSSATNGSNPMIRDTLIAEVNLRWYLALVPVTRRGKILPRSEMNFF